MHASVEQLLSLRDSEPVAAEAATHVARCAVCGSRLEQLRLGRERLRNLPAFDPPATGWEQIERAVVRTHRRHSWKLLRAVAAGVVLGIVAIAVVTYLRQENVEASRVATVLESTPTFQWTEPQLSALLGRSRELEDELRALPARPSVQRASTAAAIDSLQARIEWVDAQLSSAPDAELDSAHAQRLWRARVDLMDSLVKVRDAEATLYAF
jgi:hypothetical protein